MTFAGGVKGRPERRVSARPVPRSRPRPVSTCRGRRRAAPAGTLFGRRRRFGGRFRRLRGLRRRVGGPEMPVADRALPELLRLPGILGARVPQLHRDAAPLATNRDVGVVHGRIVVPVRGSCKPARGGRREVGPRGARGRVRAQRRRAAGCNSRADRRGLRGGRAVRAPSRRAAGCNAARGGPGPGGAGTGRSRR